MLAKLRGAIPTDLYLTAEKLPQDTYYGHTFYPGRVLLDTNCGFRVWGYLSRVKKNHRTMLELHCDDNRGEEATHLSRNRNSCHDVAFSQMMGV
jgi:hypothetical protein